MEPPTLHTVQVKAMATEKLYNRAIVQEQVLIVHLWPMEMALKRNKGRSLSSQTMEAQVEVEKNRQKAYTDELKNPAITRVEEVHTVVLGLLQCNNSVWCTKHINGRLYLRAAKVSHLKAQTRLLLVREPTCRSKAKTSNTSKMGINMLTTVSTLHKLQLLIRITSMWICNNKETVVITDLNNLKPQRIKLKPPRTKANSSKFSSINIKTIVLLNNHQPKLLHLLRNKAKSQHKRPKRLSRKLLISHHLSFRSYKEQEDSVKSLYLKTTPLFLRKGLK